MSLDFEALKKIPIVAVCARYGLRLRYRGEYANGPCPLPCHPAGDKNKNFSVHIPSNTWRCFHTHCAARNGLGDKPGDVINFVRAKENLTGQKQAAELLDSWFGNANKNGSHSESREPERQTTTSHKHSSDNNKSASDSKPRYMELVDVWLDQVVKRVPDEDEITYLARLRKSIKSKLVESFRNGRRLSEGLPPEIS